MDFAEAKFIIKSLIVSSPDTLTIDRLLKDFYQQEGYQLPYEKFGYKNAEAFLKSMSNIQIAGSGGNAQVFAKDIEKSNHIHKLIGKQKKTNSKKPSRRRSAYPAHGNNVRLKIYSSSESTDTDLIPNVKVSEFDKGATTINRETPWHSDTSKAQNLCKISRDTIDLEPILKLDDLNINSDRIQTTSSSCPGDVNTSSNKKDESTVHKKILKIIGNDNQNNDFDEAVPSFALDDQVLQFNFPTESVAPGQKIKPSRVSSYFEINTIYKIKISQIHNPFKFWFHFCDERSDELSDLLFNMERFYENTGIELSNMPLALIKPGQLCAAKHDDIWYRAEILEFVKKTHVKCFLVDFGKICEVDVGAVKLLNKSFAELPSQIFRGSLSHIQPDALNWSKEASECFKELAINALVFGKVQEIDYKNRVIYFILCKNTEIGTIQINTELVKRGYACEDCNWMPSEINKNRQRRLHPLEVNPTFDMLERGVYSSLDQLNYFNDSGINNEQVIAQQHCKPLNHKQFNLSSDSGKTLPFPLHASNPFTREILLELEEQLVASFLLKEKYFLYS